jgi:hypothetical protein
LLLKPSTEGTEVTSADAHVEVRTLLEHGASISEIVIPSTSPSGAEQLALFSE